jgi:hypothetical protein
MDRTRKLTPPLPTHAIRAILLSMLMGRSSPGRTVDVARLGPVTTILAYENGRIVSERAITSGAEEDRAVQAWLRSHAAGWRPDRNSYAPHCYLKGARFTLNFQLERCILNYQSKEKGRWVQVSRPIRADETVPAVLAGSR